MTTKLGREEIVDALIRRMEGKYAPELRTILRDFAEELTTVPCPECEGRAGEEVVRLELGDTSGDPDDIVPRPCSTCHGARRIPTEQKNLAHPGLREALADQEHGRWSRWMKYLFSKSPDGVIPPALVERWARQVSTPYKNLSEQEKDSDRKEADATLDTIRRFNPQKEETS